MQRIKIPGRQAILACGMLALALASLCGCNRQFYRLRADKEVKYLVTQKSNDPRWQYSNFTIGMDPRARYFDPTNPDCPPMPYDDPASNRYMQCVAGRKQWPCWRMNGEWYYLENPRWKDLLAQYNEITEDGAIKLSMNGAVCLAQVHSPDYRKQIEIIYLSALDVSSERFAFDVQFFGDSETVFNHQGALRSPLGEQNTLTQRTGSGFRRGLSAGGQLLVGFANTVVWQFAGPDTNFTTSLLNFSLIQPLLRNGGRAFVMERLTIAERTLLANLRAFQYYRQGFYCNVTVGSMNVPGPRREGGFFGGTGLTGFTGQGAGGFGGVGANTFGINPGGGGGGGAGGAGAGFVGGVAGGQVQGFIGLLQAKQQVANLQANLNALLGTLALLEANLDAGLIDIVQVDEFRQNIETTRANLLAVEIGYQNTLDAYKVGTLGLPPDTNIAVDDTMLEQFQFLDPNTVGVRNMIDKFVHVVGDLPENPSREDLAKALATLAALRDRLSEQFTSAHADMEKLEAAVPAREERMSQSDKQSFAENREKLRDNLDDVETRFTATEGTLENLRATFKGGAANEQVLRDIVTLGVGLSGLTQELALVKARARLETVTVPHIELSGERALDIARANRLDWMNNRAGLVDQWRLITFNANLLKAGLDLTFEGDVRTVGDNPLNFNGRDGALRVGVAFDAPLARRLQRNNYRSVLITYQQERRALYLFQDGINLSLRARLRQLAQLEENMEIQRRAVEIAVRRVDKTREDLNRPPAPVEPGMPVEALGPTVGTNLIYALNDLTGAQNNLMSVVLSYFENRLLLYRDLGILELDDCGMWIDRTLEEAVRISEEQCPVPPNVPVDWLEDAGVDPSDLQGGADGQPEEVAPVGEMPDAEPIKPIEMPGVRGAGGGALPTDRVRRTTGNQPKGGDEPKDYGLEKLPPVAPHHRRRVDPLNGEVSKTVRSPQTVEIEGELTSASEIKLIPSSDGPRAEDLPAILPP